MSWPINNSSNDDGLKKVPTTMLYRWFLYDVAGETANEAIDVFDLTSVSPEGNEKEVEESLKRLTNIDNLSPILSFYADATAEFAFSMHKKQLLSVSGITEEMLAASEEPLKEFYINMTFSALVAAFAATTELGIIDIQTYSTEIRKNKNE